MLRRNMTSAECQISDPKGRYLVFTLLFFQMPMMKTQGLNTKIITKKPKSARNCESRVSWEPNSAPMQFASKQRYIRTKMVLPVRLCLEGANDCSQETTFAHTVDISAVGA